MEAVENTKIQHKLAILAINEANLGQDVSDILENVQGYKLLELIPDIMQQLR